jgi:hypothetical protein
LFFCRLCLFLLFGRFRASVFVMKSVCHTVTKVAFSANYPTNWLLR